MINASLNNVWVCKWRRIIYVAQFEDIRVISCVQIKGIIKIWRFDKMIFLLQFGMIRLNTTRSISHMYTFIYLCRTRFWYTWFHVDLKCITWKLHSLFSRCKIMYFRFTRWMKWNVLQKPREALKMLSIKLQDVNREL